ncbi:MAG: signal recognition particle protein, partial [Syntrophales bacterium]|nr:signal recognition particle protein [Syntrophales bacterium]
FNKEIGLDGVVLTKLDCDPKGGTVVSITKMTGVPIIYVGTGQGYSDIEMFDAEKIIGEILS